MKPSHSHPIEDTLSAALGWPETLGIAGVVFLILAAQFFPLPGREPQAGCRRLKRFGNAAALWIAQGFGLGRIPFAPGTFGTAGGILWVLLLAATANLWLYVAGLLLGVGASIWLCGRAERLLQQPDPGSVVLDEMAALPICFLPWMTSHWLQHGSLPPPHHFFTDSNWGLTLVLFVLFRLFDILKPWPVRQSQRWPRGWGIAADDCLAALYVALLSLLFVP